jgi:S-adenosylmethionine/arginine decarboxylase-like enzyme
MSHIIIDIKLNNYNKILFEEEKGKEIINKWIDLNSHTLLKKLDFYTFPPMKNYLIKYNLNLYNKISKENPDILNLSGYTGFGILSESHITIHTYPEEKKIALDLYSCKTLDEKLNITFIKNFITDIKIFKHYYIKR